MIKSILISTLLSTVILFVWSGVSQNFPWGVPSVQVVSARSESAPELTLPDKTIEFVPGSLTTAEFEKQMVGKITTLTTDDSFSWIISKPMSYYNLPGYFVREVVTQFFVALFLVLLLWTIRASDTKSRLQVVFLCASATVIATHGSDFNWMGTPALFAGGISFNLIVGWMLVAMVVSRWLIKPN